MEQRRAWWVLRATSGAILRIDPELAHPIARVAASPAELCAVMLALQRWSRGCIDLASLATVMHRTTPPIGGETSPRAALLELLPEEGVGAFLVLSTAPDLSPR